MAIHKKMKGSSRGHFLRQSATSRFLSPARPLCLFVCLSRAKETVFIGESVMARWRGNCTSEGGAVTGVDLLRQGRIRIWDGRRRKWEESSFALLPRLVRMHTCRFSICRFHQSRLLLLLLLCLPLSRKYHISSLNEMLSLQSFLPV